MNKLKLHLPELTCVVFMVTELKNLAPSEPRQVRCTYPGMGYTNKHTVQSV